MKSRLSILFFFCYFCFWFVENIAQAETKVTKFIAIFYFKRFLIFCGFCLFVFVLFHFLALVFRSVIHVQWIFAYNIGKTSNSILLYVDIQLKFVEKILLPLLNYFGIFVKTQLTIYVCICFWTLHSFLFDLFCLASHQYKHSTIALQ